MSEVKTLECDNCGAPVYRGMLKCEYCGRELSFVDLHTESKTPDWVHEQQQPPRPRPRPESTQPRPMYHRSQTKDIALLFLMIIAMGGLAYAQSQGMLSHGFSSYSAIPTGPQNVQAPIQFHITCENESLFHAPWDNYTITVSNATSHVIYEKIASLFTMSAVVYVTGMTLTITINQGQASKSPGPLVETFNVTLPKMIVNPALVNAGIEPVFIVGKCQ